MDPHQSYACDRPWSYLDTLKDWVFVIAIFKRNGSTIKTILILLVGTDEREFLQLLWSYEFSQWGPLPSFISVMEMLIKTIKRHLPKHVFCNLPCNVVLDQWPQGFEQQIPNDSTGDHHAGRFVFPSAPTILRSCEFLVPGLRHAGTIKKCHISTNTGGGGL